MWACVGLVMASPRRTSHSRTWPSRLPLSKVSPSALKLIVLADWKTPLNCFLPAWPVLNVSSHGLPSVLLAGRPGGEAARLLDPAPATATSLASRFRATVSAPGSLRTPAGSAPVLIFSPLLLSRTTLSASSITANRRPSPLQATAVSAQPLTRQAGSSAWPLARSQRLRLPSRKTMASVEPSRVAAIAVGARVSTTGAAPVSACAARRSDLPLQSTSGLSPAAAGSVGTSTRTSPPDTTSLSSSRSSSRVLLRSSSLRSE